MPWKTTLRAVAALIAILGAGPAWAGEARLYLMPWAFTGTLEGEARVSGGDSGTDFDLEDTLGLDTDEVVYGIDGFFKFLGSRIEFSIGGATYEGEAALNADLTFNGVTFGAGETLATEIEMQRSRLLYGFDFNFKVVNVGFILGGHLVDIDATLRSRTTGVTEQEDLRLPIPAVGATLGIHPISWIAVHAELSGLSVTISGIETRLLDGFAGVDILLAGKVGLSAGYRYFTLEATDDDEDDHLDIEQIGPYIGLAVHL